MLFANELANIISKPVYLASPTAGGENGAARPGWRDGQQR